MTQSMTAKFTRRTVLQCLGPMVLLTESATVDRDGRSRHPRRVVASQKKRERCDVAGQAEPLQHSPVGRSLYRFFGIGERFGGIPDERRVDRTRADQIGSDRRPIIAGDLLDERYERPFGRAISSMIGKPLERGNRSVHDDTAAAALVHLGNSE